MKLLTDRSMAQGRQPRRGWLLGMVLMLVLWPMASSQADDTTPGVKPVNPSLKVISNTLEEDKATEAEDANFEPRFTLNGGIELNYEYFNPEDIGDSAGGDSSDFYVSTTELIFRAFFNEWIKAKYVVTLEDLGKHNESERIHTDEAILTVDCPWTPLYLILGKTAMPFGVFEDHLIAGTLAEDLYEVDQWGATLGFSPDYHGLDISFSVYRNPQIIENLQGFDTHEFRSDRPQDDRFESFIANVSLVPIEQVLVLSLFYDNEPGDGSRNQSVGGALTLEIDPLTFDLEYISALSREKGENEEENIESAGVIGVAIDLLDSFQLAARYEIFWDDTHPDRDEVQDDRIAAGFNFSLGEHLDLACAEDITLSFEYRHSRFEKEPESEAADSQDMVQVQLTLEF